MEANVICVKNLRSRPDPIIGWQIVRGRIKRGLSSRRHAPKFENQQAFLTVKHANIHDQGTYRCKVEVIVPYYYNPVDNNIKQVYSLFVEVVEIEVSFGKSFVVTTT